LNPFFHYTGPSISSQFTTLEINTYWAWTELNVKYIIIRRSSVWWFTVHTCVTTWSIVLEPLLCTVGCRHTFRHAFVRRTL
jgi:hypothetical protein